MSFNAIKVPSSHLLERDFLLPWGIIAQNQHQLSHTNCPRQRYLLFLMSGRFSIKSIDNVKKPNTPYKMKIWKIYYIWIVWIRFLIIVHGEKCCFYIFKKTNFPILSLKLQKYEFGITVDGYLCSWMPPLTLQLYSWFQKYDFRLWYCKFIFPLLKQYKHLPAIK